MQIGVDFGGNGSKHAFVAAGILPDAAGVVGLCSVRVDPKDTDTAFLARRFVDFAQAVFAGWGEIAAVYCDNAEQVLIASLRSALLDTKFSWLAGRVHNAKKIAITDRIRLTSILMGGGRFWVMPGAQSLADALATALWSGKTPGEADTPRRVLRTKQAGRVWRSAPIFASIILDAPQKLAKRKRQGQRSASCG